MRKGKQSRERKHTKSDGEANDVDDDADDANVAQPRVFMLQPQCDGDDAHVDSHDDHGVEEQRSSTRLVHDWKLHCTRACLLQSSEWSLGGAHCYSVNETHCNDGHGNIDEVRGDDGVLDGAVAYSSCEEDTC